MIAMTDKWIRDTGLLFGLVFLVVGYRGNSWALIISGLFMVVTLFFPSILKPLAYVWLEVTNGLGVVMPKIFFSLVFALVVLPIGLLQKAFGKDPLMLSRKKSYTSAFLTRDHRYVKKDLEQLY